jgi:coatomer subunit delta
MRLGKKTNILPDALTDEVSEPIISAPLTSVPAPQEILSTSSAKVQITLTESTVTKTNRDGGVESIDVQGQLNLHITDSSMSRIEIHLQCDNSDGTQFKTHPNVDRNLFRDKNTIALRDSSRSFPLNQQMTLVRWRLQGSKSELPISGFT